MQKSFEQFLDASREITSSPTGRYVLMASFIRYFGNNCIGFYKPLYFSNVYPNNVDDFAFGNAFMYVFIASFGALLGGYLSDKFEDVESRTKSWIAAGSTLISLPFIFLCLTQQDDFWFSYAMMCFHYSVSEAWFSPSLTMMQNTTSVKNQGFAVSVFSLGISLGALLGTSSLGYAQEYFQVQTHPEQYGYTLAGFLVFSYLTSIPLFLKAGDNYKKFK